MCVLHFVIISTFSQDVKVPYKPVLDSEVERRRDYIKEEHMLDLA